MNILTQVERTNKAIKAATLETKANDSIVLELNEIFNHVLRAGNAEQFEIICKDLTKCINEKMGWNYPSLNGIYRQGFKVTYAPNVISWYRQFCKLEISQCERDEMTNDWSSDACQNMKPAEKKELVSNQLRWIKREIDNAKKMASNDNAHQAEEPASAEEHEAVIAELSESSANEVEPVRKQLADLAMSADIDIVTELVRVIIEAQLNQEEAA